MGAVFPHPVKLVNVLLVKGALNPWEDHAFLYPHFAIPDPLTCITGYALSGDVPAGISVDGAGNIKGTVLWFGDQGSCQDNWGIKNNDIDGQQFSGWPNHEIPTRFAHQTYMFNFAITVFWKEKKWIAPVFNEDGEEVAAGYWKPCTIPGSTTECCQILEVKDHGICNKVWLSYYTKTHPIGDFANPGPLVPK
jgi:hypothetical protein